MSQAVEKSCETHGNLLKDVMFFTGVLKRRGCILSLFLLLTGIGFNPAILSAKGVPERIVSLGPINTENVFLLGAGDRLVGTTLYCVRPEAAKKTAKIGSVLHISIEKIIDLQPDLVLATGFTKEKQIKLLRNVGIIVVRFDQPSSFADSCTQFVQLGELLGLQERAREIVMDLQNQVDRLVESITSSKLSAQKVIFQVGANPLYVSGRDLFTNDFIELIRAENGMGDSRAGQVSYERVIAANPDVILIGMMGSETGIAAEEKAKWSTMRGVKAAEDGRIHVIDPNLVCSPSPETFVKALRYIATLVYPDLPLQITGFQ